MRKMMFSVPLGQKLALITAAKRLQKNKVNFRKTVFWMNVGRNRKSGMCMQNREIPAAAGGKCAANDESAKVLSAWRAN